MKPTFTAIAILGCAVTCQIMLLQLYLVFIDDPSVSRGRWTQREIVNRSAFEYYQINVVNETHYVILNKNAEKIQTNEHKGNWLCDCSIGQRLDRYICETYIGDADGLRAGFVGFPFRAASYAIRSYGKRQEIVDGILVNSNKLSSPIILAANPLWIGFAANTILLTFAFLFLGQAGRWIISRHRSRAGKCIYCSYPMIMQTCPECGRKPVSY